MTAALALIAVLLVIAVAVVALRRRAAPGIEPQPLEGVVPVPGEPARGPPLPVILVHGLFGFDRIGVVHYFRGIATHLETLGCHAHAVRLPRAASVPQRARRLVELIERLGHPRVDLIAHSLGGLDARYALAPSRPVPWQPPVPCPPPSNRWKDFVSAPAAIPSARSIGVETSLSCE